MNLKLLYGAIAAITTLGTGFLSYGSLSSRVSAIETEQPSMEKRLSDQMLESERRTRQDIQELRSILINRR